LNGALAMTLASFTIHIIVIEPSYVGYRYDQRFPPMCRT